MKILYKFVLTVVVPSFLIYVGFTQLMPWYFRVLAFFAAGSIILLYLDSDDMKNKSK